MKTPIEELSELMDVGGARFGSVKKYGRRYPLPVGWKMEEYSVTRQQAEHAFRMNTALELLKRLEVGKSIIVPRLVAGYIQQSAKKIPGAKVRSKTIDQNSVIMKRIS
jgi:hypothetical protein